MSSTHKKDFEKYREAFLQALERATGYDISTTKGFSRLSVDIKYRTGQIVSTSTLKRLYGYVGGLGTPRLHTLNTLALFAGYPSFKAFVHATQSNESAESGFVSSKLLYSKDLTRNAVIRLSWHPACVSICQYKGEDQFEVLRSENTQLIPGTTFYCTLFIEGEILYLDKVSFPNNSDVFTYKIGAEHGIVFCLLLE